MENTNNENNNFMSIYEDYEAFKREKKDLINNLVKTKSKIIGRFAPVFAVVDYLDCEHAVRNLNSDEETFFSYGFDYIYDQFEYIDTLLKNQFDSKVEAMNEYQDTINLLLFIQDFKNEILSSNDPNVKKGMKKFQDLEDKVTKLLENKENVTEDYYGLLDDISFQVFEANGLEIQTIDQIFYEVAIEYGIYDEDNTESIFERAINAKLLKTRL